jgi:hypothetical protein
MSNASYPNRVLLLIAATTLLRLVVASSVELGNDEVYYWVYSQHLQWNYFDHPPLVALWIRLGTANLLWQQWEVFVRLGSIVGAAISTWLLYAIGLELHSERAGWLAACLYASSIYASIIAGTFIMPDSPQMVFWCWCLWLMAKISTDEKKWLYWLLLGISAGLCIMSKVHGLFIWIGFGLYILFKKRTWLQLPQLYAAIGITAVLISPILIWNIQNHFITYQYHSQRVEVHRFTFNTESFFRELFGQILYNNPVNVALIIAALYSNIKRKKVLPAPLYIYNYIAIPMALLLLLVAAFRDTLPHWSGPAYVTLLPMAAIYATTIDTRIFPISLRWSSGIILFAVVAGLLFINYYPGTLGKKSNIQLGTGDFTLDMHGWRKTGQTFDSLYQSELQQGIIPPGTPVICYKWFPAAHQDYYFCRPLGIPLIGLGSAFDLHEFIWMNQWRKDKADFSQAYCIVPSNEYYNVEEKYAAYYHTVTPVTTINDRRNGRLCRRFYVYRLQGWKNNIPLPNNFY